MTCKDLGKLSYATVISLLIVGYGLCTIFLLVSGDVSKIIVGAFMVGIPLTALVSYVTCKPKDGYKKDPCERCFDCHNKMMTESA